MRLYRFQSADAEQPVIYLDLDQVRALEPGPNGTTRVILDSNVWAHVTMGIDEVAALVQGKDPDAKVATLSSEDVLFIGTQARRDELLMLSKWAETIHGAGSIPLNFLREYIGTRGASLAQGGV